MTMIATAKLSGSAVLFQRLRQKPFVDAHGMPHHVMMTP
jgi:hypothetical protein